MRYYMSLKAQEETEAKYLLDHANFSRTNNESF